MPLGKKSKSNQKKSVALSKIKPKRPKNVMPLKMKVEILNKLRDEKCSFSSLARAYGVNESTIRSIKYAETKIRSSLSSDSSKVVRDPALEKMEATLSLWVKDKNQRRFPLNSQIIRQKAKEVYQYFSADSEQRANFQASYGWFAKFKTRYSLNLKFDKTDKSDAEKYAEEFLNFVNDHGYTRDQVFNASEFFLYWKHMPSTTFLFENKKQSGQERATLILCSNASGDCVIKPMVLYESKNPRCYSDEYNENLPVFWPLSNTRWVTPTMFTQWFKECFVPEVERYVKKKYIDFKVVLLLDNNDSHPASLASAHPNVKVHFLPLHITAFLQPIDHGTIRIFKLHYLSHIFKLILNVVKQNGVENAREFWQNFDFANCINCIKESVGELALCSLKECWNKLWPIYRFVQVLNDTTSRLQSIADIAAEIGIGGFEKLTIDDLKSFLQEEDDFILDADIEKMIWIKQNQIGSAKNESTSTSSINEEDPNRQVFRISQNWKRIAKEVVQNIPVGKKNEETSSLSSYVGIPVKTEPIDEDYGLSTLINFKTEEEETDLNIDVQIKKDPSEFMDPLADDNIPGEVLIKEEPSRNVEMQVEEEYGQETVVPQVPPTALTQSSINNPSTSSLAPTSSINVTVPNDKLLTLPLSTLTKNPFSGSSTESPFKLLLVVQNQNQKLQPIQSNVTSLTNRIPQRNVVPLSTEQVTNKISTVYSASATDNIVQYTEVIESIKNPCSIKSKDVICILCAKSCSPTHDISDMVDIIKTISNRNISELQRPLRGCSPCVADLKTTVRLIERIQKTYEQLKS